MIDADRVVGRLRQLVQDAYAAAGHGSGCEHGGAEVFFADGLRTRECEEDAAGLDFLESLDVQFAVALQGIAQSIAVLGKSRRVKNYQVVLVAHAVKVFEGIFCIGGMAGVTRGGQVEGGQCKFSSMFLLVKSMALAELSTECTSLASPRIAYTEKPPV